MLTTTVVVKGERVRELIYFIATSIDGQIADAEGDTSAFSADADYLSTLAREFPESLPAHIREALGATLDPATARWDTVVMGRRTYEPALAAGIESPYAPLTEVVVSRTLSPSLRPGAPRIARDAVALVRELKRAPGTGIWLCGGGELAASLAHEIDRLLVKVNPIILGRGRPLVDGPAIAGRWRLEGVERLSADVVLLDYARER